MISDTALFDFVQILGLSQESIEPIVGSFCDQHSHVRVYIVLATSEAAFEHANLTIQAFEKFKQPHQHLVAIVDDMYRTATGAWQDIDTFYTFHYIHGVRYWSDSAICQWNPRSTRCLFLTGVADRVNRIGMLAKLYQQQLLDQCLFSFYPVQDVHSESYRRSVQIVNSLGVDYQPFSEYAVAHGYKDSRGVSRAFVEGAWWGRGKGQNYITCTKLGSHQFDVDPAWYSTAKVELVSETLYSTQNHFFVSEKIYKSIYHGMPFIVAGYPGATKYLEGLGFRTFDKYCTWPEQDQHELNTHRLAMIADNINSMLSVSEYDQQIKQDILHNQQLLGTLAVTNASQLETFLNQYCDTNVIELIAYCINNRYHHAEPLGWGRAEWQHAYNNVRDNSWPACDTIEDIQYLPGRILEELQTVHNFNLGLNNRKQRQQGLTPDLSKTLDM